MRCLCHDAGKQPNVFENEDRHNRAEVTGMPASQQASVGSGGRGAASFDSPRGADIGKANSTLGEIVPSQGCLRKSQERLAESCLHAPLTGFQRSLLEVVSFPKERNPVDGDAQSHDSVPGTACTL